MVDPLRGAVLIGRPSSPPDIKSTPKAVSAYALVFISSTFPSLPKTQPAAARFPTNLRHEPYHCNHNSPMIARAAQVCLNPVCLRARQTTAPVASPWSATAGRALRIGVSRHRGSRCEHGRHMQAPWRDILCAVDAMTTNQRCECRTLQLPPIPKGKGGPDRSEEKGGGSFGLSRLAWPLAKLIGMFRTARTKIH